MHRLTNAFAAGWCDSPEVISALAHIWPNLDCSDCLIGYYRTMAFERNTNVISDRSIDAGSVKRYTRFGQLTLDRCFRTT